MSSSSPVWRVDLQLRPSRFFLFLIFFLHAAAACAVLTAGLSLLQQIFLLLTLIAVLPFSWRQESRRTLVLREQSADWWLETATRQGRAELCRSQVWHYLVVMDFRCRDERGSWRQRVVVFPDAVSPDLFRRLRVRLRHGLLPGHSSL